jgi:hypothetical protein
MRKLLVILGVVLCGAPGCSEEGPLQPTGPRLTISPATVSVETGADPITLGAIPQNGTLGPTVTWDLLSGSAGTLNAGSGITVGFTPAALGNGGGDVVVRATGTVNGTAQVGTATVTVVPSPHGRLVLGIDPGGASAWVDVTSPLLAAPLVFTASAPTVARTPLLDAGTYLVAADGGVLVGGSTVDGIFDGTVTVLDGGPPGPSASAVVVPNRETGVQIAYALRGGTGRLWIPAAGAIEGFTENDLFVTLAASVGFAGTGARAVAFDADGNLWATFNDGTVRAFAASSLSSPTAAPVRSVSVTDPTGIAIRGDTVYVASCSGGKVEQFSRTDGTVPVTDFITGGVTCPWGVAFDSAGRLWVASKAPSPGNGKVSRFPATGGGTADMAPALNDAFGVAIDSAGTVWATSCAGNSVQAVSPAGSTITGPDLACPGGMAFDKSGTLWVLSKGTGPSSSGVLVQISGGSFGQRLSPFTSVEFGGIAFFPAAANLPIHQ